MVSVYSLFDHAARALQEVLRLLLPLLVIDLLLLQPFSATALHRHSSSPLDTQSMCTGALRASFAAAAASNQPFQLLLPTVLPRPSGVPVVAAAAVHSKSKKAKFSQKHPSKQQLKQQALKQMQQQQQQQAQPKKPQQQQQQQQQSKPAQGQQAQPRQQQSGQQQQQQSKQQQGKQQQSAQQQGKQQQSKQQQGKQQQSAQQQGKQQQSGQQQGKQQQSGPSKSGRSKQQGQPKQQNQQAHSKPPPPPPQQQRQQKTEQKQGSHKTGAGKQQQQQQQQQAAKPPLASLQDLPTSSTQKQPLRHELPLVRPAQPAGAAASAAAAAAAAAAAIQAAQHLLPPAAAGDAQEASRGAPPVGGGAATSSSSSSRRRPQQSPGKLDKVAGISYTLAQGNAAGYKAAGVVLYDCAGPDKQPRLLLVREKNGVWNLPAGKVDRGADGKHNPAATAARELEEESHSLIPAVDTLPVLASCPVFYCHASKMAIYLMRLTGGQQLPQLLEQRLAAGMQHPMAEGVDMLGWFTVDQISRGVMVSGKKGLKQAGSRSTLDAASASAAAAAAAAAAADGEGEEEEAAEAAAVLHTADVEQQLGSLHLHDGGPAAAVAQQQQQQQELEGPLGVRVPLFRNIKKIHTLLEALAKGQAPEFGLQLVQQQPEQQSEQQQEKATDASLLAPSFQQLQLPAKWAAYVNGASSTATDSSSSGSQGGQEFLLAGDSASSSAGAAGQQQSPAAAAAAGGGSRFVGQQPWAIAVWSGQHDRQQQQEQQLE